MSKKEVVEKVKTELDIDEQLPRQIKGWKMQSVGLIFIFVVLLLAAIGVFGDGLLSKKKIHQSQALIEYERFYRQEACMDLKVFAPNEDNGNIVVSFPANYLNRFLMESIVPEPAMNRLQDGYVNYIFEGTGPMQITFYLNPQEPGRTGGMLRVNDEEFMINQFIYP